MTKGSPLRHILIFSVPLLIGNIFQQLYNIADLVIVGRLLGVESFAAVGAVAPLFFLITFIIVGFTNGFAVVTGQRFGAKDYVGVRDSAVVSTILSTIVTVFCTVLCTIFMNPILHWLNVYQKIFTMKPTGILKLLLSACWQQLFTTCWQALFAPSATAKLHYIY